MSGRGSSSFLGWSLGLFGAFVMSWVARLLLIAACILGVWIGAVTAEIVAERSLPPRAAEAAERAAERPGVIERARRLGDRFLGAERATYRRLSRAERRVFEERQAYFSEVRVAGGAVAFFSMLALGLFLMFVVNGPVAQLAFVVASVPVVALIAFAGGEFRTGGIWWPTFASPIPAATVGLGAWYLLDMIFSSIDWWPGSGGRGGSTPNDGGVDFDIGLDV